MELNTTNELLRNLSIISEDETLLKKAIKYLHRLVAEKERFADESLLTKEEYINKINRAENQLKEGRYVKIDNANQLSSWLENL